MLSATIRSLLIYLWKSNICQNKGLQGLMASQGAADVEAFWSQKQGVHRLPSIEKVVDEVKEYEFEMESKNIRLLTPVDEHHAYPLGLLPLFPIPSVIAVCGDVKYLTMPQVAIVGSRSTLESAYDVTHSIVDAIASRGFCVTSGGAFGIDAIAHRRAMARRAPTIVVSPGAPESPGPSKNEDIYAYAREHGAIVSQYPCGFAPLKRNFPSRNRIIAALSSATIIVHCREKSGALYTAQAAQKLGKPVYVAAMRGMHPLTEGGLALVKQGKALLLSDCADLEPIIGKKQRDLPLQKMLFDRGDAEENAAAMVDEDMECDEDGDESRTEAAVANGFGMSSNLMPSALDAFCRAQMRDHSTVDVIRNILRQSPMTRENLRHLLGYPEDFDEAMLDLELGGEIAQTGGAYGLVLTH